MTKFDFMPAPQGPDPKRLMLAVVITSVVLIGYSFFFGPEAQTPSAENSPPAEKPAEPKVESQPKAPSIAVHKEATRDGLKLSERIFTVSEAGNTSLARASYKVQMSNRGALIARYALTDFSHERPLWDEATTNSSLLRLQSLNPLVSLEPNAVYEITHEDKDRITFRYVTKEGLSIERAYNFLDNARISERLTFKNLSDAPQKIEMKLSALRIGDKGQSPGLLNPGVSGESLVIKTKDKHERFTYGDLEKPKVFNEFKYAAFDDQFFLSAILPENQEPIESVALSAKELPENKEEAQIALMLKPFVLMHGEEKIFEHQLFMGPKQVNLLASLSPPLDENIDFGWFGVLSRPMLWLLVQIYNLVHNYGLAIILITFIIKLLTYPLTQKSFSSQQAMKELQPKLKELQQKYSHDKTLLGQKQMELYRTQGINPLAGCLPILIQLPIWFAFFQMLRNSVELFDQPFYGWITDLTMPDPYYVLPILMGISMLIQQLLTPTPADQPQMKYVMLAMPVFLTFIMLNMPSGLSLYILTNNLLTILQQMIIKRQSLSTNK